ncbi:MAG: four helix bundle protein [Jaaginema sp. PMC 1079.18]|nr:four helix bundle protein [Jaaginema sp. PMC 1080.18]MEC4852691.1 four helix bundle protein [Jaaginema sp. PMC 1079.18]MEC4867235.1 four helix bundle protein [Jaaginema sp. PMC 1078.18]
MTSSQIQTYRDLRVWQKGMDIATDCYQLTHKFPQEERYGLTSQIRRAATSIPANIAEGYGRDSKGEYIQFLRYAQGSLKELETHLFLAVRVQITTNTVINPVLSQCDSLGKMLRSLIRSLQNS